MVVEILNGIGEPFIFFVQTDAALHNPVGNTVAFKQSPETLDVSITADENCVAVTTTVQLLQPESLADRKVAAYLNRASFIPNLFVRQTRVIMHEHFEFKCLTIFVANGTTLFPSGVTKPVLDALFVGYFLGD